MSFKNYKEHIESLTDLIGSGALQVDVPTIIDSVDSIDSEQKDGMYWVFDNEETMTDVTESYLTLPVGTVIWSAGANAPAGFLVCNGSTVGRTVYPELFAVIGTKYGAGDGENTFSLPNLLNKTVWGGVGTAVGTEKIAGLPNITGSFNPYAEGVNSIFTSGSFYATSSNQFGWGTTTGQDNDNGLINFDASHSNSIYGNSDTVQPPALTLLPCIKAYDGVADEGTINIGELIKSVDALKDVADGSSSNIAEIIQSVNNVSGLVTTEKERAEAAESALNSDIAKCLPLDGSRVMTGDVRYSQPYFNIKGDSDIHSTFVMGGSDWDHGAFIRLNGKNVSSYDANHGNGYFQICAHNGSDYASLIGSPTGGLTWDGQQVLRWFRNTSYNVMNDFLMTCYAVVTASNGTATMSFVYDYANTGYFAVATATGTSTALTCTLNSKSVNKVVFNVWKADGTKFTGTTNVNVICIGAFGNYAQS